MIKPDLILIWPQAVDYPLTRQFIVDNRDRFNKVIISFTHNSVARDFRPFLQQLHSDFIFVDSKENKSWYQDAMAEAVKHVESEYVLFLEQDFTCTTDLLDKTFAKASEFYFICHAEDKRLHLAYFLTSTQHLRQTRLFFDQMPTHGLDCFDFFTAEMVILSGGGYATLKDLELTDYQHLNGLTHNFQISENKQYKMLYQKEKFKEYVEKSLATTIKKPVEWRRFLEQLVKKI